MKISAPDILLVEDNPTDIELFMVAHEMNKSTSTIKVARDGVEAIDFLLGSENRLTGPIDDLPKLVLLDLNMPRRNGFEVLKLLRADERTRLLPVVVFSSSGEKEDENESHRLGANSYVQKPAGFEKLCAILTQLEHEWLRANNNE